jgi:hypothetical protein
MKIIEGIAHYDGQTSEVVIDHLEIDDAHDGVLRLPLDVLSKLALMAALGRLGETPNPVVITDGDVIKAPRNPQ